MSSIAQAMFLTLILAVGTVGQAARGQAAQCTAPPDRRALVEVRTSLAKTNYRYDLSTGQITSLHRREGTAESRRHEGNILGLTRVQFEWTLAMESKSARLADGTVCLWVTVVKATLAIPALSVYVSSDYRQGGCEFAAILQHENSHVQRTTALLRPYAAKMEDALRDAVRRLNPRSGRSPKALENQVMATLKKRVTAVVAALEKERTRVNGQLDTEDNYRRTAARCGSW